MTRARWGCAEFINTFLAAAKAVSQCPTASSPKDLLHDARTLVATALAACKAVLEKWPLADSLENSKELLSKIVSPDLRKQLHDYIAFYTHALQDA